MSHGADPAGRRRRCALDVAQQPRRPRGRRGPAPDRRVRIERRRARRAAIALLGEFTHFFALILWVAAALAFAAAIAQPGTGMATLGAAIVGVIVVNAVFSSWQQYRAERALQALEDLLPARVLALRDGEPTELDARRLVPGDLILLDAGARVPADCRMIEAFGLRWRRTASCCTRADGAGAEHWLQPTRSTGGPRPRVSLRSSRCRW